MSLFYSKENEMIEIKNLQVKYNDFVAIDDINLKVEKGEFYTLLGPSGCGKTTTLRAIAGFLTPSKGNIKVANTEITHTPVEKRQLGMVFQSYALFPTMTVFDNIAYGLKVEKMKKALVNERVQELAKLVELTDEQLQKNVSELSGGQQQRVAIARALAKNPDVVLFDEPLSNLDAKLRKQLRIELKNIQERTGMTAIYVTHDQEEALEMSSKIAVFNKGKIEQIGTPEEIYDRSATEFVCNFIGDSNVLGSEMMQFIAKNSTYKYSPMKVYYIRTEKLLTQKLEKDDIVQLPAIIEKIVFKGNFYQYYCNILGSQIIVLAKNDQNMPKKIGKQIDVYVNPQDILSYEVQNG